MFEFDWAMLGVWNAAKIEILKKINIFVFRVDI